MDSFNLKKIVITGASRGIGKALALEFSKRGAELFLLSRDSENLSDLCDLIVKKGNKADFSVCDVSNREQMLDSANLAFKKFGRIDIVILNAGRGGSNYFNIVDNEKIRQIFNTNFFGILNGLEAFIPIMQKQEFGTIAGVGSLAESRGLPGTSAYGASKISVSHILEAARIELKKQNIKIVTIKPGFIKTQMTADNKFKMPFLLSAEQAAIIIANGLEKEKPRINFPIPTALFSSFGKIVPGWFYEYVMSFWYKSFVEDRKE